MSEARSGGREPALDGIRAIAVLAVVAFHGELRWASGGFLGVDVFFVLSGYLITRSLLTERRQTGTISLGDFWSRRMRRILPALLVLCAALVLLALVDALPADAVRTLPGDAGAALLSVANWRFLLADQGYFGLTATPSLLEHTWSLSIEEQFYLLWAPVVVVLLRRRTDADRGPASTAVLIGLAVAVALSASWMAWRAGDAWAAARAYWDTFARLQGPLIGAALAVAGSLPWTARAARRVPPVAGTALAAGGLGVLGLLFWQVDSSSPLLFPFGFLAAASATAAVIAGLRLQPAGAVARILSVSPLAGLGLISYGIYLWHWPLLFVLTGSRTGQQGAVLHGLRLVVTIGASAASYLLVERRIQRWRDRIGTTTGVFAFGIAVVMVAMLAVVPSSEVAPATAEVAVSAGADVVGPGTTSSTGIEAPGSTPAVGAVTVPAPTVADRLPVVAPTSSTLPSPTSPTSPATTIATPPPAPTAPVPPTRPGPPVRIAVFGDSVAESIARALAPHGPAHNVRVIDDSVFGCGVAPGGPFVLAGVEYAENDVCPGWREVWAERLDRDRPDVAVFVLGRHEVFDRVHQEEWTAIGSAAYDDHLRAQLETAVDLALEREIPVVLLTAPYFAGREAPGGGVRPENQPSRVRRFNELLREVETNRPGGRVRVVDLGGLVSPNGRYAGTIDGVVIRNDGVHFAESAGGWLAPRLLPHVVAAVA